MGREFDASVAGREEILERARRLRGKRLIEVLQPSGGVRERSGSDKGAVGQLVERFFNIQQNSDSAPDFPAAGIELKVVPLKRTGRGIRAKERTVISTINFVKLAQESWQTASVRKKLESILFVFYDHVPASQAVDARIRDVTLWSPESEMRPRLERDWAVVRDKAFDGRAHEISESDGELLAAATKAADGTKRVEQYLGKGPPAKPRAWALKASLTTYIFDKNVKATPEQSLVDTLSLTPGQRFEAAVTERLGRYRGRTMAEVADELGVPDTIAKSANALLVRRILGVMDDKAMIREFDQFGIGIKTVPVSEEGKVLEAMSFPRFVHSEVVHEEWEDSDLLSHLERLLIVPIIRSRGDRDKTRHRVGRSFFWSPSAAEREGMRREWEMFVERIRRGHADSLPTAGMTRYLHVRPKARDGRDTEVAPGGRSVVKKCFWLNQGFLEEILRAHGAP